MKAISLMASLGLFACASFARAAGTDGSTTTPTLSSTEQSVFELAQELYPALFANGSALAVYQGYTYKYFAASKIYVGLKDGHVYLMGGPFGAAITDKGPTTTVLSQLQALKSPPGSTGPTTDSTSGTGTVATAAALVISSASPSSLNGSLNKAAAQFETGSSNALATTYNTSDPYCRVAAYSMSDSGNGKMYYLELTFSKTDGSVGLARLGDDASFATVAQITGPVTGIRIDIVNRRIGFTNVTLSGSGTSLILNGTLEYPTNFTASNRPSCG